MYRFFIIWVFITTSLIHCARIVFDDAPVDTPANNFRVFWNDFDKYYAQFGIRNIDWDSIDRVYTPLISSSTTDLELFNFLADIIGLINDGHVNLFCPFDTAGCRSCLIDYTGSRLLNPDNYIIFNESQPHTGIIEYGHLTGHTIGFIILKSFMGQGDGLHLSDERFLIIDEIIREFSDENGLVIDVRSNLGGIMFNAETIASRFADKKRPFFRFYQKNGSSDSDYSGWHERFIEPQGPRRFLKPVVVLTSRLTYSSAELFVMAMSVFPQVIIVGDTTGGGIGNPIYRELPNGWTYRLSTKVGATIDNRIVEGNGIPPDFYIVNSVLDSIRGTDRMLETGIGIIENNTEQK